MSAFPVADEAATKRALVGLVRGERWALAGVIALSLAATAAGLAAPWLLGRIIDRVGMPGAPGVDGLAAAIVGFAAVQLVVVWAARRAAHRMGERATARLREEFIDRMLRLPSGVVERAGTGDLVTRSTSDVAAVGLALRDAAPDLLLATAEIVLVFGAIVLVDPLLGAIAFVALPPVVLVVRWYRRRGRSAYLALGDAASAVAEGLSATAEGARTIEAYGLAQERVDTTDRAIDTAYHTRFRTLALRLRVFFWVEAAHRGAHVLVLVVGGLAAFSGRLTVGEVTAAALYAWQLADPLARIAQWLEQVEGSAASLSRIAGVDADPEPVSAETPVDDRIRLSGVRFAYVPGRDVLHGIDLDVRPGEHLAIVGPSGAGKSTVGRLIAGIERPRAGSVLLGGVPVAEIDPAVRTGLVVLVTQEHHVFRGSLRDNLAVAAPDADDAALLAALAVIGWPGEPDLDAPLDGLAPDRAQLLAMARVVLRDPHTVVLDEATSVLDPKTARAAERALAAVLTGRTVIAIAHRLHTAHDADRVAVVDRGRITELGPHDELLAAGGPYAALWRSWHG